MPETKYLRCTCASCGGHIEFPADGIGMTIPCPHCAWETELMLEASESASPLSSRSFKWAIAGVVILMVGVAGILAALNVAKKIREKRRASAVTTEAPRARKPDVSAAMVVHANNFSSSQVTIEKKPGSTLAYAVGIIKNQSDAQRFGVTVELDLFDAAGAKVGTAKDYRELMEGRAEWRFRALLVKQDVASAAVISVREQP